MAYHNSGGCIELKTVNMFYAHMFPSYLLEKCRIRYRKWLTLVRKKVSILTAIFLGAVP